MTTTEALSDTERKRLPVSVGTVLVLIALIGVMLAPLASDPLIHTTAAPLGSLTVGQKVEIARLPHS